MNIIDIVSAITVGLISGLLVNYLSDVLPRYRKLRTPICIYCDEELRWIEYLSWWQRCPSCSKVRSFRTWLVLPVYTLLSLWNFYAPVDKLGFLIGMLLLVYFGVVTVIDLEWRLILHPVSLTGMVLGFIIGVRLHGIWVTVAGGLIGFAIMLIFYGIGILYVRLRLKGNIEVEEGDALGFGDVNLSAVVGLILGWPGVVLGVFIAILLAGIVSLGYLILMLILRRFRPGLAIAYGPYIVLSAVFIIYFKNMVSLIMR